MKTQNTNVAYKFLDVEIACEAEKNKVKYLFLEWQDELADEV